MVTLADPLLILVIDSTVGGIKWFIPQWSQSLAADQLMLEETKYD